MLLDFFYRMFSKVSFLKLRGDTVIEISYAYYPVAYMVVGLTGAKSILGPNCIYNTIGPKTGLAPVVGLSS